MDVFKNILLLVLVTIFTTGCEDTINVDVPTSPPKLVIEASLVWFKGTTGAHQKIKLSLSAPYFDASVPAATGATITVTDSRNNDFQFIEDQNTGIYICDQFVPKINETYTLTIHYNKNTYIATETLYSVSSITRVEQNNDGGFSGNETELKAFYSDPENEENYYFFEFINAQSLVASLEIYDDEFTNGNEIFGFYSNESLNPDDDIIIQIHGVSKQFYQFMFILLQQNNEENGDPFDVQPATLRGNCINLTDPDNFPLGYFRVSEADQFIYKIQ